jgi:hypothetical protein
VVDFIIGVDTHTYTHSVTVIVGGRCCPRLHHECARVKPLPKIDRISRKGGRIVAMSRRGYGP